MPPNPPPNLPPNPPPNPPQYSPYGGAPFPPPAPPKKKSPVLIGLFGCGGLVAVIIVLAVVGAITGAGKSSSNDAASPAASAPKAAGAKKPAKHVSGIGDEVRDGKFAFKVTKLKSGVKRVGDQYFGQDAQGQFTEVLVNVSNISNKPQTFFGSNQKLFVGKQQYDADDGAAVFLKDSKSLMEPINPGNAVKGTILFDLPRGAKPTKIELHDSAFSGGVTVSLR
jgi:Domain of unknown function (DUF4352)